MHIVEILYFTKYVSLCKDNAHEYLGCECE